MAITHCSYMFRLPQSNPYQAAYQKFEKEIILHVVSRRDIGLTMDRKFPVIENKRCIFPTSNTLCGFNILCIVYVFYMQVYPKSDWGLTSSIYDLDTHNPIIHLLYCTNISNVLIPSFTSHYRWNIQHIAYMSRHDTSAHYLYTRSPTHTFHNITNPEH